MSEPIRIDGMPGYETRIDATSSKDNTAVTVVQWLRFGGSNALRAYRRAARLERPNGSATRPGRARRNTTIARSNQCVRRVCPRALPAPAHSTANIDTVDGFHQCIT